MISDYGLKFHIKNQERKFEKKGKKERGKIKEKERKEK